MIGTLALPALVLACLAGEARAQQRTLSLDEAVMVALDGSSTLRQARFGLEEAGERVSEAWGLLWPKIDGTASYQRNLAVAEAFLPAIIFDPNADPEELIPVRFGSDNVWTAGLAVDQALFKPGVFVGLGAASRFKNLQEEIVRGEAQAVVTRVRIAYYNLLLQQEQVRLTENSVRRVRRSLEETRSLNEAGLAADYDVLRLEVELANLEPNLRRARNAVEEARRQFAIELNLGENADIAVEGNLAEIDLDDPDANTVANRRILAFGQSRPEGVVAEEMLGRALEARTDVRQLEATERLRQTELRLEQVSYLPEISLFGNIGITVQENGGLDFFDGQRTRNRFAGIRLSWPLFSGFSKDARIDQKRAALRAAEEQSHLTRERARSEVRTLADRLEEARLRARAQRLAVRQAQRGFEIASAQYREGLGSQLELTDAEVALRQSEFNYAQAVYDYLVAQAQMDQALGRVPYVDTDGAPRRVQ